MSIGLSRNARLLLLQLVQVHQRGKRQGLRDDRLSFTLAVGPERTTVAFACGDGPIETSDVNAVMTLRANGLIEEFTTIDGASHIPRYIVTQTAVILADRPTPSADPDATGSTSEGSSTSEAANAVRSE